MLRPCQIIPMSRYISCSPAAACAPAAAQVIVLASTPLRRCYAVLNNPSCCCCCCCCTGDGPGQHPTQALLDLYSIRKEIGRLQVGVPLIAEHQDCTACQPTVRAGTGSSRSSCGGCVVILTNSVEPLVHVNAE